MHDWKETIRKATASGADAIRSRGDAALEYYRQVVTAARPALRSMLSALTSKQIDRGTFDRELLVERRVMRAELQAHRQVGKDAARVASTVFFNTISRAVRTTTGAER